MATGDLRPFEGLAVDVQRVVAGRVVAAPVVHERRLDLFADLRHVPAARVEATTRGWVDRARDVSLEHDPLPRMAEIWIRDRHRREERLGVRHDRPLIEILRWRELDQLPQIHDCDPVAHVPDYPEVMGDEDVRELELPLQVV